MRAAVYHGPNALKVDDVPEPQVRPGTVKLQVGFNGIPIDDVVDEGFEALHAGTKMKVLVDPKGVAQQ
ncbi:hypothetical protein [Mycobacterium sp. ITM-2016-00317]|uniref:hypothetical protein n=1 Tax=Mycobacterium sp. ITM-2016-00317 TaxID=2099694 RepID=UPI0037C87002